MLVSGRFAMLDDSLGFRLVPWKPVIEQWLGQNMTALVRGDTCVLGDWPAAGAWHFMTVQF